MLWRKIIRAKPIKLGPALPFLYLFTGSHNIEFLWRVFTERPLRSRDQSSTASTPSGLEKTSTPDLSKGFGRARLTPNIRNMLIGLCIATVFIYLRSIYRTIELLGGWNGAVFINEKLFSMSNCPNSLMRAWTDHTTSCRCS